MIVRHLLEHACQIMSYSLIETIANTDMDTPRMYFSNAPRPSAPSSANRSAVSSRPGNRSSMIDYDSIPSPRASTSTHRSRLNGATTPIGRSKSNLSQVVPSSAEEEDEDDRNEGSFGDMLDDKNDDFDLPLPDHPSPEENRSFTEIEREEDEPELEPHRRATISSPPSPRRSEKLNRKETTPEEDQADEIRLGLDNVGVHESEGDEVAEEPPKKKRGRQPTDASKPVKRKKVSIELSGAGASSRYFFPVWHMHSISMQIPQSMSRVFAEGLGLDTSHWTGGAAKR